MSNSTTEDLGVSYLKILLDKTHLVHNYITTNDKGVSWDGYISIFKKESCTKKDFYGNIPVQIKTTHEDNKNNNRFQISKDDLINYKTENRIMYFHIALDKRDNPTIFYLPMHLLDLERNIKSIEESKDSKAFAFKRFPKNNKDIIDTLFEFVRESFKQKELLPGILSINDLIREKGNVPVSFDISVPRKTTLFDLPKIIEQKEPYIRYRSEDTKIEHVVDRISGKKITIAIEKFANVGFDDEIIYENKTMQGDSQAFVIECSNNFVITITPEQLSFKYNFSCGSFDEKCDVAKFLNRLIKDGKFIINGQTIQMSQEEREKLESKVGEDALFFARLDAFLKEIHSKKEPILTSSENDFLIFHLLSTCVLDNKPVMRLEGTENGLVIFDIFGLHLLFCVISSNNYSFAMNWCDNKYISLATPDKPNEKISPYYYLSSLSENYFLKVDNIDIDLIEENIFRGDIDESKAALINNIVMNLISYYDAKQDTHILEVASSIIKRLLEKSDNENAVLINNAQIEFRNGQLSSNTRASLDRIISNDTKDQIDYFACLTLLSDNRAIDYYDNLDPEIKKSIEKWPIIKVYQEVFKK